MGETAGFYVQLFGGPRLFQEGREMLLSPQQASLILVVFGREEPSVTRLTVCSLLWSECEPERNRRNLNQLLYSLKKKIPVEGILEVRPEEIRKGPRVVSIDLEDFQRALRSGALGDCSSLLRRGFGARIPHSANRSLTDWMEGRAAELRRSLRDQAEMRWRTSTGAEDWPTARAAAEALFELAPGHEVLLRRVMEARAKTASPWEAEEAFIGFSEAQESAWEPDARTQELLEEIRSLASASAVTVAREVRREEHATPLLGRADERGLLRTTLARVPSTQLQVSLVSGEAGIGKTRLIEEATQGITLDGHRVFFAQAAELERLIPLNPLIELFKGEPAGSALRNLKEPWRTVLFGVMPDHYPGEGPVPEPPHIQQGSVPRRLFEAFYKLLLALVRDGSLILILEDIQWADDTTLTVLEFLVRRWDQGGLQFIASVRSEEIRRNPVLGRLLATLRMHPEFVEIPLTELTPGDSGSLIQHLAGAPLGEGNVSQLRSLAGGNPYFLIELTLEYLAGRLGPELSPQEIVPIPVSIRQVLSRRLSQLSPDAELVLGTLAVFSRALDRRHLPKIARISETACLSGLDQLHKFRLVSTLGTDERVSHELVRQTVYQTLTETRRNWLHQQIAQHILDSRKTPPPDELAIHFHHAGMPDEAARYGREAADHAETSGAIPEALRFLRIARDHSTDPETVVELINKMGHLNYLDQKLEEAAPLLEIAAQRFRRLGEPGRALWAEIERIDCLAQMSRDLGRDCLEELQVLKEEAKSTGHWEAYHKALDVEAHQLDREGDINGVRSVITEAAKNLNRGTLKARCASRAIVALNIYFGSAKDGLKAAREAVEIALTTSDSELILRALNRLIVTLHFHGKLQTEEGEAALAEANSRIGTCGDLILKFYVQLNPAVWFLEIGELDFARTALDRLGDLVQGTNALDAQARLLLNRGELALASHELERARLAYEAAEQLLTTPSPPYFRTLTNAGLGLCALSAGDLTEARLREEELPTLPEFWTFDPTVVATFKARLFMKRQDTEKAVELMDQIRSGIRDRWATVWLRLTLEEARILRTVLPERSAQLTEEGLSVAVPLGLNRRIQELRALAGSLEGSYP